MLLYRAIEDESTKEITNYKLGKITNNSNGKIGNKVLNSFDYSEEKEFKHFFVFAEEAFKDATIKTINNNKNYMVAQYSIPNEVAFENMGIGLYIDLEEHLPVLECAVPFKELEKTNCITGKIYELEDPENFIVIKVPKSLQNNFFNKYRNKIYKKILKIMNISYNPNINMPGKLYVPKGRKIISPELVKIYEQIIEGYSKNNRVNKIYKAKKFYAIKRKNEFLYTTYKQENARLEIKQIHLKDIINLIKNAGKMQEHISSVENINLDKIFKSELHGILHNERVSLIALAIAIQENVSNADVKILLEAAKYHDIGRINDNEEPCHGTRSSELIDDINLGLNEEDKNILKAIMIYHSIDDNKFDDIIEKTSISDVNRCRKLCNIFKDADGLDRVRLMYPGALNDSYLRTDSAKKMVLAAYELFYNYK